jgi:hypothetical protein
MLYWMLITGDIEQRKPDGGPYLFQSATPLIRFKQDYVD